MKTAFLIDPKDAQILNIATNKANYIPNASSDNDEYVKITGDAIIDGISAEIDNTGTIDPKFVKQLMNTLLDSRSSDLVVELALKCAVSQTSGSEKHLMQAALGTWKEMVLQNM